MRTIKWVLLMMLPMWSTTGFAFSSDGSSLTRDISTSLVLTNSLVTITVTFTNAQTNALRGFYYTEHLPSEMTITTEGISINGQATISYFVESGVDSEVYAGRKPRRWIVEEPPGFLQANAVPASGIVQVTYTLRSAVPGIFQLDEFSWVAYDPANANPAFGHSEQPDRLTLSVVEIPVAPSLECSYSDEGFKLAVAGVAGTDYSVESSTNLVQWLSLATVSASSVFLDTNTASFGTKYYRARWVSGKKM